MDTNDIKNLKAGQVVYLQNYPVTFKRRTMAGIVVNDDVAEDSDGNMCYFPAKYLELERFHPANGTKNTETAPKYDPCREFRKGDKVKAVLRHGRIPNDGVPKDVILEVVADERDGVVKVLHKMGVILEMFNVYALYLELVTPIEELEPYIVRIVEAEGETEYHVEPRNNKLAFVAIYGDDHPYAKAAAEAERDRLDAEYRKEQSNG